VHSHVPIRTCAGCGRRAAKGELVRFVARHGVLASAGEHEPGRSAYTCRRLQCFERAVERNAFARTLHTPVSVERDLIRLYTDCDG
jgi:predicted RNA-binding protein YlxR (DUF448 family)